MREFDNDNLVQATALTWAPRLARPLTPDDSSQIMVNLTGFAGIVAEWARKEAAQIPVADNDNAIGDGEQPSRTQQPTKGATHVTEKKADQPQGASKPAPVRQVRARFIEGAREGRLLDPRAD